MGPLDQQSSHGLCHTHYPAMHGSAWPCCNLARECGPHLVQTGYLCLQACVLCSYRLQLHRLGSQPQDIVRLLGIPSVQPFCRVKDNSLIPQMLTKWGLP